MPDMDEIPVLALDRLKEIARAHNMPSEVEFGFIVKCIPDLVSGDAVCIWGISNEEHIVMQARRVVGLNIKEMNK
jgi:hypothetical protein